MRFYTFLELKGAVPNQGNFRNALALSKLLARGAFCRLCLGWSRRQTLPAKAEQEAGLGELGAFVVWMSHNELTYTTFCAQFWSLV